MNFLTQHKTLFIEALVRAIVWSIAFIYIRKGLNKQNFIENPDKKRQVIMWDGIYGGFAAFIAVIANKIIINLFKKL